MNLKSDHIFISDKAVLKYVSHPKSAKGATLPFKEFWKMNCTPKVRQKTFGVLL